MAAVDDTLDLSEDSDNRTIYLLDDSDHGTMYLSADDDDLTFLTTSQNLVKPEESSISVEEADNDHETIILLSPDYDEIMNQSTSYKRVKPQALGATVSEEDSDDDDDEILQLLLMVELHCVGLKYYSGVAHQGEYVQLVRDPYNVYDRNAIRVDNLKGEKIGHIKANEAIAMAQIMDDLNAAKFGVRKIDGSIPRPANKFSQPILVEFYCRDRSTEDVVRKLLRSAGIDIFSSRTSFNAVRPQSECEDTKPKAELLANNLKSGATIEPPKMDTSNLALDWKSEEDLDAIFDKQQESLMNMPLVEPPSQLTTTLMKHQVVGLSWMYHREKTEHVNPLFYKAVEKGKNVWMSTVTKSSQVQEPAQVRGGLLCDDMGMGKSIMTLSLILKCPPAGHIYGVTSSSRQKPPTGALKSASNDSTTTPCITTLIVCPVSVMSNWYEQVDQHVKPGALRVATYQGPSRGKVLEDIARNRMDIVLVSYQTLGVEFKNEFGDEDKEGPPSLKRPKTNQRSIFSFRFHRIVLDEAHIIRNPKASMSKACLKIDAEFRFGLTGTPIINKAEDACTLFQFLGVEPISSTEIFRRSISQPVREGNPAGLALLRTIFSHFALRRTKEKEGITLPLKTVEIIPIKFPEDSVYSKIYSSLFLSAKTAFVAILTAGDEEALKEYMSILELILRLRQACCAPILIPQARLKRAEAVCKEIERRNLHKERPMTAAEGRALLEKLQGVFEENTDGTAECAVCLEDFPKENATILRTCMHSYCEACITNVLSMNPRRCPLCRADFEQKDVVKMTDASNAAKKGLADEDTTRMKASSDGSEFSEENLLNSPKIQELLQQLQRMGGDEKAVIFSQFTQFLNVITRAVDKAGFRFTRIDGTMSAPQRIKAMNDFNSNSKDSPRLILCSLMAAGTGINLTRGNWCFMMDSWWNKAVEDQAMDRIHRIGQSRPVTVVKLIIQDTIEERIIKLQESKAMILKGTLEKLSGDEMRQARLAALMGLFGIEDP